jgi:DNA processing protein
MSAAEAWTLRAGAPGYPGALEDLDHIVGAGEAPGSEGAPVALHGCGSREAPEALGERGAVTIVGARRSSAYGRRVAEELAGSLAAAGVVVVSGMAFGIDSAAHRGALAAGGVTIAVLAGGADIPYPPSARDLHRRILESGGAAISEAPFGARPARWDFPARNRIMAALGAVTVVVEARERSGSRITADKALALGREVGAVPGPVDSPLSAGPHGLYRDGAFLATCAQDVLDRVLGVGVASARRVGRALDEASRRVLDLVGPEAATAERLAAASALPAQTVAVAVARLELLGYIRADGGHYARSSLTPP